MLAERAEERGWREDAWLGCVEARAERSVGFWRTGASSAVVKEDSGGAVGSQWSSYCGGAI